MSRAQKILIGYAITLPVFVIISIDYHSSRWPELGFDFMYALWGVVAWIFIGLLCLYISFAFTLLE